MLSSVSTWKMEEAVFAAGMAPRKEKGIAGTHVPTDD
jgi:hypothetical protein